MLSEHNLMVGVAPKDNLTIAAISWLLAENAEIDKLQIFW